MFAESLVAQTKWFDWIYERGYKAGETPWQASGLQKNPKDFVLIAAVYFFPRAHI